MKDLKNAQMARSIDVSVVIPVYNASKYISKCIESVLTEQSISLEIIIIDDGSKDNSLLLAQKYAEMNKNIRVIHKKNGGVSSARNIGIQNAIGNYIFFLDVDDVISEGFLSTMFEIVIKHNIDLIEPKYVFDKLNSAKSEKCYELFTKIRKIDFHYKGHVGYCAGKFIRRTIIEDNNLKFDENMHYSEDKNFILRMLAYAEICCIHKGVFYYVSGDNSNSLSKKYVSNFLYCRNQSLEAMLKFLKSCSISEEMVAEIYHKVTVASFQAYFGNFYRKDSLLKHKNRIKMIKNFISENKDIIDTIEKKDSMNFYSVILNNVIKTKNVNLIDFVFWIKSIAVQLLPRRH